MTETRIYRPKGSIFFTSYIKSKLSEVQSKKKLTDELIKQFSKGL